MQTNTCLAFILAGGRGSRLDALTTHQPKPLVPFGGEYRLIDFTLSNCVHSKIPNVGVVTQYLKEPLHSYLDKYQSNKITQVCRFQPLPSDKNQYSGTADAVFWNMDYLNKYSPEHVLILSSDHIYKMDYCDLLTSHIQSGADVTIATTEVPWEDTSRYGIVSIGKTGKILKFEEKPKNSKSNTASMGIYAFKWSVLKNCLMKDHINQISRHDFGKSILPMLVEDKNNYKVFSYPFSGYWCDVGTVDSYWRTNMLLLSDRNTRSMFTEGQAIYSGDNQSGEIILRKSGSIDNSIVAGGTFIAGHVKNSVVGYGCSIDSGSMVIDSVIMPKARIGRNVIINKAVIDQGAVIGDGMVVDARANCLSQCTQYNCQYTKDNIAIVNSGIQVDKHQTDRIDIPAFVFN